MWLWFGAESLVLVVVYVLVLGMSSAVLVSSFVEQAVAWPLLCQAGEEE
jgi:hypothetical protein